MNENLPHGGAPQLFSMVDPYVYQTLQSIQGSFVVIETTNGKVQGTVKNVLPDHVVIDSHGASFYVRIQQIVWILPS